MTTFNLHYERHWQYDLSTVFERGILNSDIARWLRFHVSRYDYKPAVKMFKCPDFDGYEALTQLSIDDPKEAMLFKLTWM